MNAQEIQIAWAADKLNVAPSDILNVTVKDDYEFIGDPGWTNHGRGVYTSAVAQMIVADATTGRRTTKDVEVMWGSADAVLGSILAFHG